MKTINFELNKEYKEYIELIKLLKFLGLCNTGGEAKVVVEEGLVKFNGVIETQKRKKIRKGDKIQFNNTLITII